MRANWKHQADLPVIGAGEGAIFQYQASNLLIRSLYTDLQGMAGSRVNKGSHSNLKITEILDIFSTPKIIMKTGF